MGSEVLDFYKSQLFSPSTTSSKRIENLHRVHLIAHAIGVKKTVNKLLPLLKELEECDDDEFLYTLAEEYPNLLPYIGEETQAYNLLLSLESLAKQDETIVREKAISSMSKIIRAISHENRAMLVECYLLPMVDRLSKGEWLTNRVSACGVLLIAYEFSNESQQSDLIKTFSDLCEDETPMVRRAASQKFCEIVKLTESKNVIISCFMEICRKLWNDVAQENIRLSVINVSLEICKKLNTQENIEYIMPVLRRALADNSWRVRQNFAKLFPQFIKHLSRQIIEDYMLENFNILLNDVEAEVRCVSLSSIEETLVYLKQNEICMFLVPTLCKFVSDNSLSVRGVLSSAICATLLYIKDEDSQNMLISVIVNNFAKDANYIVKLNVVSNAGEICRLIQREDVHNNIVEVMQLLISDTQWRVRYCVVQQVSHLANYLDSNIFESKLEGIILRGFLDSVFAVREASINSIQILARKFGAKWTSKKLLKNLMETFYKSECNLSNSFLSSFSFQTHNSSQKNSQNSYITRITVLHAIPQIAAVLPTQQINETLVPVILKAMKDSVPNVRFVAAKTAAALIKSQLIQNQIIKTQIKPGIEELMKDDDIDVKFFAEEALSCCS